MHPHLNYYSNRVRFSIDCYSNHRYNYLTSIRNLNAHYYYNRKNVLTSNSKNYCNSLAARKAMIKVRTNKYCNRILNNNYYTYKNPSLVEVFPPNFLRLFIIRNTVLYEKITALFTTVIFYSIRQLLIFGIYEPRKVSKTFDEIFCAAF